MSGVEDTSNPAAVNQEEEKKPLDGTGQHINLKVKGQVSLRLPLWLSLLKCVKKAMDSTEAIKMLLVTEEVGLEFWSGLAIAAVELEWLGLKLYIGLFGCEFLSSAGITLFPRSLLFIVVSNFVREPWEYGAILPSDNIDSKR